MWDQSDVLGVGAQEVLHGASQEQGLVHPVQLQGAVHAVHLQLSVVRGIGLQTDLRGLVPQQAGGLPLGTAPGPGEDKGTCEAAWTTCHHGMPGLVGQQDAVMH